jgi:uncharacterized membrane protein
MTNGEKINLIGQKILILSGNLDTYKTELDQLRQQLALLQVQQEPQETEITPPLNIREAKEAPPVIVQEVIREEEIPVLMPPAKTQVFSPPPFPPPAKPASTFNLEEFVGSKLISIIGIVVLVIGLSIGVKYAIDRNLITPLTRIVLAYAAGGILLAIALRLKEKYKAFSAILLSGGMASLYFTTYAAYSMYDIFPQMVAFAIMVIFTAFTVFAATVYELEVIGIIGLVGAYAVPVLLSDGSGKIQVMFTYMLIINTGILVLSFKKYWQILNHIAFGLSWLIVGGWVAAKYDHTIHFPMVMIFSFLFFIIFYISNMSYKIMKQEKFGVIDIVRLLSNSFIFFAIGYSILDNEAYSDYLGMFTLANALVHLVFSYIVFRNKLLDRKLFYLLIAMVLTFITIAIPVQLEGSWVTLIWSAEAALLFVIGRYKAVRFYEWLGAIMISLSVFSLLDDWGHSYYVAYYDNSLFKFWTPFLNIHMFTSLFFIAALGSMTYVHVQKKRSPEEGAASRIYPLFNYLFPVLLFIFTYLTFSNEINAFFKAKYEQSYMNIPSKEYGGMMEIRDYSWPKLQGIATGLYSVLFFCIVTILAIRRWNHPVVRWTAFSFNILCAFIFIIAGLNMLGELRTDYLSQDSYEYYPVTQPVIFLRYLCFLMLGILLYLTHQLLQTGTFTKQTISRVYAGCIVHFFILVILSNELINLNILNNNEIGADYYKGTNAAYKMGFTVLWGVYSFILIAWGIFKRNRIMRISAISLFGITLIKLVTFDTWDLSTGYKIIAFILLGVILLVVAFLYQKFKVLIFGEDGK